MSDFYEAGVCMMPANFGPLHDYDGNARITGSCGDTMEFWISVSGSWIEDARYTSDGCYSSNKCGSTAALLVRGMPLSEAGLLTPEAILARAGDVPDESRHCALLAANTLKAAIRDYRRKQFSKLRTGAKVSANARSILNPKPKLIVSCRGIDGKDNALVVAYAGNCSFDPPSINIGILPARFSHHIIKETGCFVANLVTPAQKDLYDFMGSSSGRAVDKFATTGVRSENGIKVNAPILTDCPVNIECSVQGSVMTGSHEMFIGRIEYVHADEELVNEDGSIDWDKIELLQ